MDIELWSKEAPLACRNFVQLCMEGYYNGVVFHRIVRDFIAQTGDPTGSGEGNTSLVIALQVIIIGEHKQCKLLYHSYSLL